MFVDSRDTVTRKRAQSRQQEPNYVNMPPQTCDVEDRLSRLVSERRVGASSQQQVDASHVPEHRGAE